jgi:hypothetical protein
VKVGELPGDLQPQLRLDTFVSRPQTGQLGVLFEQDGLEAFQGGNLGRHFGPGRTGRPGQKRGLNAHHLRQLGLHAGQLAFRRKPLSAHPRRIQFHQPQIQSRPGARLDLPLGGGQGLRGRGLDLPPSTQPLPGQNPLRIGPPQA